MKMDVALFLLAFALFWKSSQCIRCFKCYPERVAYKNTPICQDFDVTQLQVDCDTSTMCFKRITTLSIGNKITETVQRGCAQQTQNGEQKKINGKWVAVRDIHEAYEESCTETDIDQQRPTKTVECYCRGDLCNAAGMNMLKHFMLIPTLVNFILLR